MIPFNKTLTVTEALRELTAVADPDSVGWNEEVRKISRRVDGKDKQAFYEAARKKEKEKLTEKNKTKNSRSQPTVSNMKFFTVPLDRCEIIRRFVGLNPAPDGVLDKLMLTQASLSSFLWPPRTHTDSATVFFVKLPLDVPFCGMCGLMTNKHVFGVGKGQFVPTGKISLLYRGYDEQPVVFGIGERDGRYAFATSEEGGLDVAFIEIRKIDIPSEFRVRMTPISTVAVSEGSDVYLVQLNDGHDFSLSPGKVLAVEESLIEHTAVPCEDVSGSMLLNSDGCIVGVSDIQDDDAESTGRFSVSPILAVLAEMKDTLHAYWERKGAPGNYDPYLTRDVPAFIPNPAHCGAAVGTENTHTTHTTTHTTTTTTDTNPHANANASEGGVRYVFAGPEIGGYTAFLQPHIAEGLFRWAVQISCEQKPPVFWMGVAPSDQVEKIRRTPLGSPNSRCRGSCSLSLWFVRRESDTCVYQWRLCGCGGGADSDAEPAEIRLQDTFLITLDADADARTVSFSIDKKKLPSVVSSIHVPFHFGMSAENNPSFVTLSLHRLLPGAFCMSSPSASPSLSAGLSSSSSSSSSSLSSSSSSSATLSKEQVYVCVPKREEAPFPSVEAEAVYPTSETVPLGDVPVQFVAAVSDRLCTITRTGTGTPPGVLYTLLGETGHLVFLHPQILKGVFRWGIRVPTLRGCIYRLGAAPSEQVGKIAWLNPPYTTGSCCLAFGDPGIGTGIGTGVGTGSTAGTGAKVWSALEGVRVAYEERLKKLHNKVLITDGVVIAIEVNADERTLSFFVDEKKAPFVVSNVHLPLNLGISVGDHPPLAFTTVHFRRLARPTSSLAACKLYECRKKKSEDDEEDEEYSMYS